MTAAARIAKPVTPVALNINTAVPGPMDRMGVIELSGARTRYGRDEEIFGEGDAAEYVYKILSGAVRLYRVLSDGRRQIGAFYFAGETFGLEACDEHGLSAEAVTDCEIVATPRRTVFRHAERNAEFAHQLWTRAASDLAKARDHMMLLGRQTATERVAAFLLGMAEKNGGGRVVTLPMSRQDIADYLGLTIETVSRTLTHLEEKAALEVTASRRITLRDPAALRRLNS